MLPALIRKFHDAKIDGARDVEIWGTGTPRREFLHVDDLADACLFLMDNYDGDSHINVGTGDDLSIRELAEIVRDSSIPTPSCASTRASPTARRASCSTWVASTGSDGRRR